MAENASINRGYIIGVSALTFILPLASALAEFLIGDMGIWWLSLGKWFIFYAVGVRLFLAGIRQISKPAFTSKEIFHIESDAVLPIVRELGFANLCAGLVGIIALFCTQWRFVSAFSSGLYYGIAGIYHFIKKPSGINEQFAMITDMVIAIFLIAYLVAIVLSP